MRLVIVVGWLAAFVGAFALGVVTRRAAAWIALALLVLPAAYLLYAVRYGTR